MFGENMVDIRLQFSVGIIVAVVLGELVSVLWYSEAWPWGRWGERYMVSAIICDVGLAFLMQYIMNHHWSVRKWEDAAFLGLWLALLYACLEGPHVVWGSRSFSHFVSHTCHKFVIMFVMSTALWYCKKY